MPTKRDGKIVTLNVEDLVPGDIVFLRGGNIVPADCHWLEGDVFQVDTAALTGEGIPRKIPSKEYGTDMLSGCVIKIGEGFCKVDKTGVNTEIGAGMVAIQDSSGVELGFFEQQIFRIVTGIISLTILDIIFLTLFQCVGRKQRLYNTGKKAPESMLLWDLAIIVAAVPIALPLIIQVC